MMMDAGKQPSANEDVELGRGVSPGNIDRIVPREIVPVGMILRLFLGTLSAWEDSLSLLSCPCDQPVISEILKKMGTISHDPSAF
jgi:hypothetical protein